MKRLLLVAVLTATLGAVGWSAPEPSPAPDPGDRVALLHITGMS